MLESVEALAWLGSPVRILDPRAFVTQGGGRFQRMTTSVEAGAVVPPADLRYLKKASNPKGGSVVGKVITFLQSLYESVAETLPDMRGEADCEAITLAPGEELAPDPYADAMDEVKPFHIKPRKKPRHFRSIKVDPALDVEQDDRYLPPGGHMKDYWEQMLLEDDSVKVSFCQFWRAPMLLQKFLLVWMLVTAVSSAAFFASLPDVAPALQMPQVPGLVAARGLQPVPPPQVATS